MFYHYFFLFFIKASAMINPAFQQRKDRSQLDQNILTGGLSHADHMSDALKPAAASFTDTKPTLAIFLAAS